MVALRNPAGQELAPLKFWLLSVSGAAGDGWVVRELEHRQWQQIDSLVRFGGHRHFLLTSFSKLISPS